jgi:hypothetical protein
VTLTSPDLERRLIELSSEISTTLASGVRALRDIVVQSRRARGALMTGPIVRDPIYRRRRFDAEIIELCVRRYITYRLSHRDLVAMMAERGISVSQRRFTVGTAPESFPGQQV